ncbi:MAG: lysophospholipid acyltransferase family protein [Thermodesulfobacteriota bacterium]
MEKKKKLQWHRYLTKGLVQVAKYTVPYLYFSYFWFVWATSRVIDRTSPLYEELREHRRGFVAAIWHQEVLCVPWVYGRLHPHTIASVGDSGEVITRLLRLSGFTVFRGGSSKRKSRRKKVLEAFIQHLKEADRPAVGITVDGSSGPAFRMKTGAIVMAMEIQAPVFVIRTWCKRRILLRTWDRMMLPLPFNKIVILAEGPYPLPDNLDQKEVFERFHRFVEDRLLATTYKCFTMLDHPVDERLLENFPEGWKPPPQEEQVRKESG